MTYTNSSLLDAFSVLLCQNSRFIQKLALGEMSDTGLNLSHVVCLRIIDLNSGGVPARVLCETTGYDKALVSRMLSVLADKGYITRNPADTSLRRGYRYILTEMGSAFTERINKFFADLSETLVSDVPDDEIKSFYRTAALFTDKLRAMSERTEDV
jgi:DNA-binding MarR family transcriptional regulator